MAGLDDDALSHVSSEQGEATQTELGAMTERIRSGELTMRRVLSWVEDATAAARDNPAAPDTQPAAAAAVDEPGFTNGKRARARENELPLGRSRPALHARVEVEFEDFVYCGTVSAHHALLSGKKTKAAFSVAFDADGDNMDVRCGEHRFRVIERRSEETAGAEGGGEDEGGGEREALKAPRRTPTKRQRPAAAAAASSPSASKRSRASAAASATAAATAEPTPPEPAASSSSAASSPPASSGGFPVSSASEEAASASSPALELSQKTSEIVGAVTNDLDASFAQVLNMMNFFVQNDEFCIKNVMDFVLDWRVPGGGLRRKGGDD